MHDPDIDQLNAPYSGKDYCETLQKMCGKWEKCRQNLKRKHNYALIRKK